MNAPLPPNLVSSPCTAPALMSVSAACTPDKSDVGQGLQQGCVLATLLFSMFFTAVLRVAEKRFVADAVMSNMMQLQQKEKDEQKSKPRPGNDNGRSGKEEERGAHRLWGMLYADDMDFVSQSTGGLKRIMVLITEGRRG